jgi:hypothetical protein
MPDYYSSYYRQIIDRGEIARTLAPGADVDKFIAEEGAIIKKAKQEAGLK